MGVWDWIGFVTGVVCVYLIVREKDYNWPIGVINSAVLLYVFWRQKLWATVGLQTFYAVECFYGWWMWTRRDRATGLKVVRIGTTTAATSLRLAAIGLAGVAVLYPVLRRSSDPFPLLDAIVGVASLVAEYMLCLKLLEGWHVYFCCDLITVYVLYRLGQWVTLGTYAVFIVLCVMGIREWLRRYKNARAAAALPAVGVTEAMTET